jgi:hypothetical protein
MLLIEYMVNLRKLLDGAIQISGLLEKLMYENMFLEKNDLLVLLRKLSKK